MGGDSPTPSVPGPNGEITTPINMAHDRTLQSCSDLYILSLANPTIVVHVHFASSLAPITWPP